MGSSFDAQIVILEHKSIICAGYSAVLHIHSVVEEVQIKVCVVLCCCIVVLYISPSLSDRLDSVILDTMLFIVYLCLQQLIALIDRKTGKKIAQRPR